MNAHPIAHPTERTLHAYGLGKLDEASAESVNSHLDGCPDCRERVAALSSDSFLGRLRAAGARPGSSRPAVCSFDGLSRLDAGPAPAAPRPPGTLPPGLADLPDYEILRELGQGGMGTVLLARNTLVGRTEVLKIVSGHLVNRRDVLDRFLGEIRNAAKLHHPNVVAAYTAIRLGESIALAMEYVDGLDLSRLVKARGPLPVANACYYIHQAALGLQHAHEHGMIHRDIKPSNLMLSRQGNRAVIKLLDFGLAKVQSEGATDSGLTHEGQMLGTPAFIAPEQIRDARDADIRADIYSLGCTLYYLLAGQPPFRGNSLYDILQAHHSMEAMPLNLARPEVPVELAALVAKMMAKEPARRFQEPKDVAQALVPFFKKADIASQASSKEVSRGDRPAPGWGEPPIPAPAAPRQTAPSRAPLPPPLPLAPAGMVQAVSEWESRIPVEEADRSTKPAPAVAGPPRRRPPWTRPAIVAASVVGALALGVIIYVATRSPLTDRAQEGAPATAEPPPGRSPARGLRERAGTSRIGPSRTATAVIGRGDWRVEGEELRLHKASGEEWILFGDRTWRDYDYRFEVFQEGPPSGISVLFRSPDDTRIQHFGFGWLNFKICGLEYAEGGKLFLNLTPLRKSLDEPIRANRWYELKVVVRGKSTRAYCDGQLILQSDENRFDTGRVGMRTWRTWAGKTRFRNIRVTAPDGTVLWTGPPQLPWAN